jgi:hypothetical protein
MGKSKAPLHDAGWDEDEDEGEGEGEEGPLMSISYEL